MPPHILTNAHIYSFDQKNQPADTVVVENGFISAIGKSETLVDQFGRDTALIDLRRSVLMPSFTDAHIHLLLYGQSLLRVNTETDTKQECLKRVTDRAKKTQPRKWIIGHGWNHNIWANSYGSKEDLDTISEENPIYLTHKSLHSGWANSAALEKAGIGMDTPDPQGGTIQRDSDGKATGILFESAMHLVESVIPEPISTEVEKAILTAQTALNQFGITAVHDFDPWSVYEALDHLNIQNKLSLRVTKGIPEHYLSTAINNGLKSGSGNDWLKIGWLKLFSDGALGPQTAAMIDPYEHSESQGMLFMNRAQIQAYGEKALPNGIALAVHAIGDRANREVLSAMADLHKSNYLTIPDLLSRIEHVQIIQDEDAVLLKKFNITASMQPIHAISDMDMAELYWGSRCSNSYAWRKILENGSHLIFGSDAPVESPNPFYGLYSALTRKKLQSDPSENKSWIPEQSINLAQALNAYISLPPMIGGFRNILGKISMGFAADIVVLPEDFLTLHPDEMQHSLPIAVMVDGKWVARDDKIDIEFK